MLSCKEEKLKQANEEAGPDHRPAVRCCLGCQIECLQCQFGLPDWAGGGENPFFSWVDYALVCPPCICLEQDTTAHEHMDRTASHRHTPLFC